MYVAQASILLLAMSATACSGGGMVPPLSSSANVATPQFDRAVKSTQGLWVANGTNVVEFLPNQLHSDGMPVPLLSLNSRVFGAPQGVVFDKAGDLWVIDGGTISTGGTVKPALYKFTPSQLQDLHKHPRPRPAVTIHSSSFVFPQQAVYNMKGNNLWVTDNGANAVYVFTAPQLAMGGSSVTPAGVLKSNPAFQGPLGLAFDSSSDLYVANNASTTIFKFNAMQLPMDHVVTRKPSVVLSSDANGSIQGPWALVFDARGDLWSSNANAPNTVVEFAQSQLGLSGSPTPMVTLFPTTIAGNLTLSSPNGIAFDERGNLAAISSVTPFGAALFSAQQLLDGGAVPPRALLVGGATTLNAPAGDVFGPAIQ
jgi:hypothetical protein